MNLDSKKDNNQDPSEVKVLLEDREVQVKPESKEEIKGNLKKLQCYHCHNFLFGAKTCKACSFTYCSKCHRNSTKCPESECDSKDFKDVNNILIRNKLSKVLLECEKECGEDGVSMFNYLEHIEKCEGNFNIIII